MALKVTLKVALLVNFELVVKERFTVTFKVVLPVEVAEVIQVLLAAFKVVMAVVLREAIRAAS